MKKNIQQKGSVTVILIIIILLAIGSGSYFYLKNKKTTPVVTAPVETTSTTTPVVDTSTPTMPPVDLEANKDDKSSYAKNTSKKDIIESIISSVKEEVSFPLKISDDVTWTSIEARDDAIVYKYSLKKADPENSNTLIKKSLVASFCPVKDIKNILDNDIYLDYIYLVENSKKTYFASISKADCI